MELLKAIDLIGYATEEIETREANVYLKWKAQIDNGTQLALIDHREILITSSLDWVLNFMYNEDLKKRGRCGVVAHESHTRDCYL